MKNIKLYSIFAMIIHLIIFVSCSNIDEELLMTDLNNIENNNSNSRNSTIVDDRPSEQVKIVLGEKLKNPYSVANMQNAFDYYNRTVTSSTFKNKKVTTTHYYIKIMPSTEAHLETLDELDASDDINSPVMHDFPLDKKILQEGDYYIEPKSETDLYYPIYSVIPVGYQLPNNIPFIKLENLYKPTEEEYDVETVALVFADWQDDLQADSDCIPTFDCLNKENLSTYLNASSEERARWFGKRFRPSGNVMIENTKSDKLPIDPLKKVKISIGRSFWWKYTYTNDKGHFTSPKKYRGKVRIRIKWRGYTATIRKTWNEVLGFMVSDHLMTLKRRNNGRTKVIKYAEPHSGIFGIDLKGGHLWYKGTVHNGLRKYIDYCNDNGISRTIRYANVWAFAKGGSSSTPMLHKLPQLPYLAQVAGMTQGNFWHAMVNNGTGIVLGLIPPHLRPDQMFRGLKDKKPYAGAKSNTILIDQLIFHESGHYSHAMKAGASFWAQVFAAEVGNSIRFGDPYFDGTKPNRSAGQRIALAEGWATFTEFKITDHYYGKAWASSINSTNWTYNPSSFIDNFDVYDTPMNVNRFDNDSWFLHGILWDILDNTIDNNSKRRNGNGYILNNIQDNLYIGNGANVSPLFDQLGGTVHNASQLKQKLLAAYPAKYTAIHHLFKTYGY